MMPVNDYNRLAQMKRGIDKDHYRDTLCEVGRFEVRARWVCDYTGPMFSGDHWGSIHKTIDARGESNPTAQLSVARAMDAAIDLAQTLELRAETARKAMGESKFGFAVSITTVFVFRDTGREYVSRVTHQSDMGREYTGDWRPSGRF